MRRLVELLDTIGHRLGWCPRLLCDLHEYHLRGEWPRD